MRITRAGSADGSIMTVILVPEFSFFAWIMSAPPAFPQYIGTIRPLPLYAYAGASALVDDAAALTAIAIIGLLDRVELNKNRLDISFLEALVENTALPG
jgi:hypothetical protein